jgi:MFS family permease
MTVGGLVFVFSRNIVILTVSAVIFTVGGRIPYTPAEQAMLSEKVSSSDRTAAFSVNSSIETIAAIFGSFAAAIPEYLQVQGIVELISYKPIFMIFFAAGLTSFIGFLFISENYERDNIEEVEMSSDDRKLLTKWSTVIAVDIIGGSFIGNFLSYWFYLKFNVGLGMIGTLFGASRLLAVFSYYFGFWMSKRVGTIRSTVSSRIPVVVINYITPIIPSYIVVAYLRGFMSLFSMIDVPLRQSYLMGVLRSRRRASAAGVVAIVSRLTAAGAPLLSGYLIQFISVDLPFYIAASFQLTSACLMFLMFKDIRPPEEEKKIQLPLCKGDFRIGSILGSRCLFLCVVLLCP